MKQKVHSRADKDQGKMCKQVKDQGSKLANAHRL